MRNVPEHTCQGRRHTATPSHGLSVAVTAGVASQDVTKAEVRELPLNRESTRIRTRQQIALWLQLRTNHGAGRLNPKLLLRIPP